MKDFLLLKHSLTFRKKKGFKNSSTSDTSTSTLNHQNHDINFNHNPTLEEMIMRLDLEASRPTPPRRMSCVDSSDILQSARNALSQYHPRFSLDGKDAMYRSSFMRNRPSKVAGERVIWCKPSVVGKLMGLEAIPIPVRLKHRVINTCLLRKQNLRRSSERQLIIERSNRSRATTSGYKPISVEIAPPSDGVTWPMHRFR